MLSATRTDATLWGVCPDQKCLTLCFTLGSSQCRSTSHKRGRRRGEAENSEDKQRAGEPGPRRTHLNLRAARWGPGARRARGWARGGAERGCGCVWVAAADVKQSGAPWRLSTITFNYNNWCLSPAFAPPTARIPLGLPLALPPASRPLALRPVRLLCRRSSL